MYLTELTIENFRNLECGTFPLDARGTVVVGPNGVGKTNFLEAVAVFGNVRSFRSSLAARIVRHGATSFRLAGEVVSSTGRFHLELITSIGPPLERTLSINGRSATIPQYLQIVPCFVISGADRELVFGPPRERRALLDRFTFLLHPTFFDDLRRYRRGIRQRNAALAAHASDDELDAWDERLAKAAAQIVVSRCRSTTELARIFEDLHGRLANGHGPHVSVSYRGESWLESDLRRHEVEDRYLQRYNETRVRDRQAGYTLDGPHRHDVSLRTEGRDARHVLSSGQAKIVAASLRLATLVRIEQERSESFPVIIDDVDAELDNRALARLVRVVEDGRQILLSSTSRHVAESAGGTLQMMRLDGGAWVQRETAVNG